MVDIPEDIISDILSRVPVKTVGRCRCVSKPWKSLLSDPQFIKTHLDKTQTSEQEVLILSKYRHDSLYLVHLSNGRKPLDETDVVARKLDFIDRLFTGNKLVAQSCNGLILLGDHSNNLCIINTTTKHAKHLPNTISRSRPPSRREITEFGIGYDSVNDDYKVVVIFGSGFPEFEIEKIAYVYSLRNDAWKAIVDESLPTYDTIGVGASGVYVDGCIHWVAAIKEGVSWPDVVILTFDLHTEKFHENTCPGSEDSKDAYHINVMRLGGCLGVRYILNNPSHTNVTEFWKMEEYGVEESWTKYLIIDPHMVSLSPICFMGTEQLLLSKEVEDYNHKLVLYNLKDGTFKNIGVHCAPDRYVAHQTFAESLVSPHRGNGTPRGC